MLLHTSGRRLKQNNRCYSAFFKFVSFLSLPTTTKHRQLNTRTVIPHVMRELKPVPNLYVSSRLKAGMTIRKDSTASNIKPRHPRNPRLESSEF